MIAILGVIFNTQALHLEKRLLVQAKPLRVQNMFVMIHRQSPEGRRKLGGQVSVFMLNPFRQVGEVLYRGSEKQS